MLSALVANDTAFHAYRLATGNGAAVVHFEVSRHCSETSRANCFAHGFVEQGGNDSAMQISRVAFEAIRDADRANDCAIFREQEFELQSVLIRFAATEAAILSCVGQWCEIIEMGFHRSVSRRRLAYPLQASHMEEADRVIASNPAVVPRLELLM